MTIILSFSTLTEDRVLTEKNSVVDVISSILACRLRLIDELDLITKFSLKSLLISSKKRLSKYNTVFLKIVLFVTQLRVLRSRM